ncbi:helix-turn-helix domain-containing protein [Teichococcus cervicalis]|nr:helix-turn-helix domain-containing protein [Pseudoroseomonas cervicalis]
MAATKTSGPEDMGRQPLSLGMRIVPGESIPGFMMRFAGRARFPDADRLAIHVGLRQPGSATSGDDIRGLATLSGADPAALEAAAYRPTGRLAHHRFLGGELHREFIDISRRRACPACLAAAPIQRAAWDCALVTACSHHALRFVDRCHRPRCRGLGWNGTDVTRCACGTDLRALAGMQVSSDEAEASARVLALAKGEAIPWLPPALLAVGPADLLRLVMVTGMFLTAWRKERRIETLVASGPDAVARVVGAGLAAVEAWPVPLHGFLAATRAEEAARAGRFGATKTMGAYYGWLAMLEAGPFRDALAEATRQFLAADPVLGRRMHRSLLLGVQGDGVALKEVALMVGRSVETTKRMAEAGLLPMPDGGGRGLPAVIGRAKVEELAAELRDALTLDEASAALGVSRARVRRLAEAGVLEAVHRAAADGWGRWAFRRASIEGLPGRMAAGAPIDTGLERGLVDFEVAAETMRRRGVGLADFVGIVLSGNLPVAALDHAAVGLKRLRFDRAAVRRVAAPLERGPFSAYATAALLGLKREVVAHLIRRGLLKTEGGAVTAAELDRFREVYVSGAELARERGTSPRKLAADLQAVGVLPVTGPGVDGGRQAFFRRADAAQRKA